MRAKFLALLIAVLIPHAGLAAEVAGEWLVKDKTAHIRIADCAGALWGVVSWEAHAGIDDKNPDLMTRGRPTLGMPVLIGLKPSGPDRWDGAFYNSENGKTYTGWVALLDPNRLHIRGCVLGFLCGGEDWTRVAATASQSETDAALCARVSPS